MSDEKLANEKALSPLEIQEVDVPVLTDDQPSPTGDFDEAYKLAVEGENISYTPEEEARLLRKIDWHILPIMCAVYMLQYVDKTTLSYSSIMGIQTDTNLVGDQYSWLGGIFYFGYMCWEYPANRLMQKLPLAKYTGFNIIVWGGVLACTAATKNFSDLMAVRFFLGVFESSVSPGFAYFTGQWYRKHEQGTRTGIWYGFQGIAQIFGGLVAYGIAIADSKGLLSIPGWKVLFLLIGLLTLGTGVILTFVMPDSPVTARFLNERERKIAIERIRANQQGIKNTYFKMYQVKEALLDLRVWLFCAYAFLQAIPNGGLTNYFSILIESFGYTQQQSLIYGTPGGAVQAVAICGLMFLGDYFKHRLFFALFGPGISLLGMLILYCLPDDLRVGKLIGWYLIQTYPAGFACLLSLISTNIAGFTKKTTSSALYFIAYCVGNLIGPQVFQSQDAPKYTPALIVIIICWVLCILTLSLIWYLNVRDNHQRDVFARSAAYVHVKNQEFLDLTDKENKDVRYAL